MVPASDQRWASRRDIDDVSHFHKLEVQHFFEVYKELEPGKSVEGAHWEGRREAEAEIERSFRRAAEHAAGTGTRRARRAGLGRRRAATVGRVTMTGVAVLAAVVGAVGLRRPGDS